MPGGEFETDPVCIDDVRRIQGFPKPRHRERKVDGMGVGVEDRAKPIILQPLSQQSEKFSGREIGNSHTEDIQPSMGHHEPGYPEKVP